MSIIEPLVAALLCAASATALAADSRERGFITLRAGVVANIERKISR